MTYHTDSRTNIVGLLMSYCLYEYIFIVKYWRVNSVLLSLYRRGKTELCATINLYEMVGFLWDSLDYNYSFSVWW